MTLNVRTTPISPRLPERMIFDDAPMVLGGVMLGADLADAVVFLDGVADGQAFGQVQRHRLLQVDVLAGFAGRDGLQGMPMRGRGNDHGVELLVLQQLAVILEIPCTSFCNARAPVSRRFSSASQAAVTTTSGYCAQLLRLDLPHVAAADDAEPDPLTGWRGPAPPSTWLGTNVGTASAAPALVLRKSRRDQRGLFARG